MNTPDSMPGPAAGGSAPMAGDMTSMSTPESVYRFDPWNYREDANLGDPAELVGYRIEAVDGHIGKVDRASTLVGDSYLVVDTGPWIFGKKVLLPAGTVSNVDRAGATVYVDRTKRQIKDSPELDTEMLDTPEYRDKLGTYYGDTYTTPPVYGGGNMGAVAYPPVAADQQGAVPPRPTDEPLYDDRDQPR